MGYGILSEDFCAICLWFAKGNLVMTIDHVIRSVERYQREVQSTYGVGENDFEEAIAHLVYGEHGSLGSIRWDDHTVFSSIPVNDLIEPMLRYYDVWFHDGETYWSTHREMNRRRPTIRNVRMRHFFQQPVQRDPDCILRFLEENGWNAGILEDHLYGGQWRRRKE